VVRTLITDKSFETFEEPSSNLGTLRGRSKNTEIGLPHGSTWSGSRSRMAGDPDHVLISRLNCRSFRVQLGLLDLKEPNEVEVDYTRARTGPLPLPLPNPWGRRSHWTDRNFDETDGDIRQKSVLKSRKGRQLRKAGCPQDDLGSNGATHVIHWDDKAGLYLHQYQ